MTCRESFALFRSVVPRSHSFVIPCIHFCHSEERSDVGIYDQREYYGTISDVGIYDQREYYGTVSDVRIYDQREYYGTISDVGIYIMLSV